MLRRVSRNDIKMEQQESERSYEQPPPSLFSPPIKIELDLQHFPPIQWARQPTPPQQKTSLEHKQSSLRAIQHTLLDNLARIISPALFSTFRRKFANKLSKPTAVLFVLQQVRNLSEQKKEKFYGYYAEAVEKMLESDGQNLAQEQINCLKDSIPFVQDYIQRVPSKAICSFFGKHGKNKVRTLERAQQMVVAVEKKFLSEDQNSSGEQSEAGREPQNDYTPFLIYKKNEPPMQAFPADYSYTPHCLHTLLP